MNSNKDFADCLDKIIESAPLKKLIEQQNYPALCLLNLVKAYRDGNQELLNMSAFSLITVLDCEQNTFDLVCKYQSPQQNYSLMLDTDFAQGLKANQRALQKCRKQGVNTDYLQRWNETLFFVATKLQDKHLQCQEKFGRPNHPSVQDYIADSAAVDNSNANDGKGSSDSAVVDNSNANDRETSNRPKTLYQQEVGMNDHREVFVALGNGLSLVSENINKILKQVPVTDKSQTNSAPKKDKPENGDDLDSNNNFQEPDAVEFMEATEKPTNVSEEAIVVYFDLPCQEKHVEESSPLSYEKGEHRDTTYLCRFYLFKEKTDDHFHLTNFTAKYEEKKLLPIDISSRTSARNALFVSNLINNGNLSIRQGVAVMDVLGVRTSKTALQNLKDTVDNNIFKPAAQTIEALLRELIDFVFVDETHFTHLSDTNEDGHKRKNHSFLQQICSGPNSNIQGVVFMPLASRSKECMDEVIDFKSFENLKGFESDGLKQYQDYADLLGLKSQRCLAHAFRYTKAPFIDLIQCIQQNFYALKKGLISQEMFDALIESKQHDLNLDEYDQTLFETAYAMQTIFYVEEQAKAKASSIIEAQTATGEKAKQIRLQVTDQYRKDFVIPLQQIIECNINKLKALSKGNRMLSSTQLRPLTYLVNARDSLFTFIDTPELEASNNRCEGNFKILLQVRRNNNDLACSKKELERIAHFRTLEQTLKINGWTSFKEQLAFQYSLLEAQFKNAVNQAATIIFAVHTPAKDPKTGFYDITAFMNQFKIAQFADTFNCNKFMFDLMTSKGVYFPSDLDDNLNRLFKRKELTIQIKREQLLESYLHRFKFDSRFEEIRHAYPKLFNSDAAKAELDKMDLERQVRRKARQKRSSARNKADGTIANQIENESLSTGKPRRQRMTKRVSDSSISQASVNNDEKCSYESPAAS